MSNLNKLAPQKTVYAYVDLRSTSQALVQNELSLIKNNNLTFVESLAKLSPKTRKSSILCKALNYKARTDEDIVSQALLSLQQASIKYFEILFSLNNLKYLALPFLAIFFLIESLFE